jgi:hypothetical protein
MDAGKLPRIVIPVVVGSSPISHPIENRASAYYRAIIFE